MLNGKTYSVTGASRGFGLAFTQALLQAGANVGMVARNDEVMLQVNTNFLGTVYCAQAAIPLLRGQENPRIVNISSASALP